MDWIVVPKLDPNAGVQLHFTIPRWLHDKVKEHAENVGLAHRKLIALMIYEGCRDIEGLPKPPRGTPVPTVQEAVDAFATGQKMRGPCGVDWEKCNYERDQATTLYDMEFCGDCGIRVL